MMTRHLLLRNAGVVGLVAVALAGCSQMRTSGQTSQMGQTGQAAAKTADKTVVYQATLSGSQEVPPTNSPATGNAEVQFNSSSNMLTWKVTYRDLTSTAAGAHIHGPAPAGQNAGVVVPFTNVTTQPIQGQATITPQQARELADGQWYVNVHSTNFPNGEIRGQLRPRQ